MNPPETFACGRCSCGGVCYHLTSAPMFVHCCHCTWCQRESGSAFALNAIIESDRLVVSRGSVMATTIATASGKGQRISYCPDCLTTLWSNYAGMGEMVCFVRVGTLDNPQLTPPDIHIHTESRQPWVRLPDDVPVMERYYRAKEMWPQQSAARFRALRAGQER
jgi:hypothetical protein